MNGQKALDFLEAIIALAEKANTPETQAIKTLALHLSNEMFKETE